MPKKPKSLASYIINTKARITQAAFEAGKYLYGINLPKKNDPPAKKLPPAEGEETEHTASPFSSPLPAHPHNDDDEYSKGLMRFEHELAALRHSYKQSQDDVDRNALHFRILRLERARQKFLDENN